MIEFLAELDGILEDREGSYGPPEINLVQTAELWKVLFGWDATAEKVCQAIMLMKLSRFQHNGGKDNAIDIAGYAVMMHRCRQSKIQGIEPLRVKTSYEDGEEILSEYDIPDALLAHIRICVRKSSNED